jgi:hypothetical protein
MLQMFLSCSRSRVILVPVLSRQQICHAAPTRLACITSQVDSFVDHEALRAHLLSCCGYRGRCSPPSRHLLLCRKVVSAGSSQAFVAWEPEAQQ